MTKLTSSAKSGSTKSLSKLTIDPSNHPIKNIHKAVSYMQRQSKDNDVTLSLLTLAVHASPAFDLGYGLLYPVPERDQSENSHRLLEVINDTCQQDLNIDWMEKYKQSASKEIATALDTKKHITQENKTP